MGSLALHAHVISLGDLVVAGDSWKRERCACVARLEGPRIWIHTQLSLFVIVDLCKAAWIVDDLGWILVDAVLAVVEGWVVEED